MDVTQVMGWSRVVVPADVGMDSNGAGWVTKTDVLLPVCTHQIHTKYYTVSAKQMV